eukprot:gb/GEZN01006326.1/.p1 GENE.gb/GEZN01006326.1/~~gb/GEZN01006326.1/.p1  ORF type:complete len:209 (+),score=30.41 gb/GEZN01006326.1/:434-1060(+)
MHRQYSEQDEIKALEEARYVLLLRRRKKTDTLHRLKRKTLKQIRLHYGVPPTTFKRRVKELRDRQHLCIEDVNIRPQIGRPANITEAKEEQILAAIDMEAFLKGERPQEDRAVELASIVAPEANATSRKLDGVYASYKDTHSKGVPKNQEQKKLAALTRKNIIFHFTQLAQTLYNLNEQQLAEVRDALMQEDTTKLSNELADLELFTH